MADTDPQRRALSRRAFVKSSAGVAVAATPAAIALSRLHGAEGKASTPRDKPRVVGDPTTAPPQEPVMAYVHDAQRGEVTVMSGTRQITYQDPNLARRLLDAAAPQGASTIGGGLDVIAP